MIKGTTRTKATLKGTGETVYYHYAFRGGPQFWLGAKDDDETTPGYLAAYKAVTEPEQPPHPPTVSILGAEWQESSEWQNLAPRTRKDYERGFRDFEAEFGEVDAERLMNDRALRGLVRVWIERNGWRNKEIDYRLDAAKAFARWLTIKDEVTWPQSLLRGVKKGYKYRPRAEFIWTNDQVAQFRERARPELVRGLNLLRGIGGRIGDAVWIGPEHAKRRKKGGWALIFTPRKTKNSTGAVVNFVATPEVEEIIRTTPEGQKTFLLNSHGRPWQSTTLGREIKETAVALGIIPNTLRTNDLRGTSATEMAWKEGMTVKEMALRYGWTEQTAAKMMGLYTSRNPDALDG
jgi:hypothetical protein